MLRVNIRQKKVGKLEGWTVRKYLHCLLFMHWYISCKMGVLQAGWFPLPPPPTPFLHSLLPHLFTMLRPLNAPAAGLLLNLTSVKLLQLLAPHCYSCWRHSVTAAGATLLQLLAPHCYSCWHHTVTAPGATLLQLLAPQYSRCWRHKVPDAGTSMLLASNWYSCWRHTVTAAGA